jgi:hypothetical protein
MVLSFRPDARTSARTPAPLTAEAVHAPLNDAWVDSLPCAQSAPLLNELLNLILFTEKVTDQYARLRRTQATKSTQDDTATRDALTWIQTSLEDITATLEAITREPVPSGRPALESLQGHPASRMPVGSQFLAPAITRKKRHPMDFRAHRTQSGPV